MLPDDGIPAGDNRLECSVVEAAQGYDACCARSLVALVASLFGLR